MKPIIVRKFILLRRSWIRAIVIYPFMFFKESKPDHVIFRHEMEHVYQVRRDGWFRFYIKYLVERRRVGYRNIQYEIVANDVENDPLTEEELELYNSAFG